MSRPRWYQLTRWPDYARRLARCVVLVTVPLLVGTLRGTTTMAMVADARGFGASKRRGSLRGHKTSAVDIWGYAILITLVVAALVLNHLNIGARYYGGKAGSPGALRRGPARERRNPRPPAVPGG